MNDLIFAVIVLCIAVILLAIYCASLNSKIKVLNMLVISHDKSIQDLYIRKANREPMIPKRGETK